MTASSPQDSAMAMRFVGERLAPIERAAVRELRAQGREHERPVGVSGGERVERHLQDLDLVGVDGPDRGEVAAVVGQGGGDEPFGVAERRPLAEPRRASVSETPGRRPGVVRCRARSPSRARGSDRGRRWA